MRTQEQESRPFSLSLWMDEESAAAAHELVSLDVLERHLAGGQPPDDEVAVHSPPQWAYLQRPVVPLVDGTTGAGA